MNTSRELELDHAQNQVEPENQAGLVPGPDPDQKQNFPFFPPKIKSTTMPVLHVKGQPGASTYVREKGVLLFTLTMKHPVDITGFLYSTGSLGFTHEG